MRRSYTNVHFSSENITKDTMTKLAVDGDGSSSEYHSQRADSQAAEVGVDADVTRVHT